MNLGFGAFSCSCVHISFLVSFLGFRALSCTRVLVSFLVSFSGLVHLVGLVSTFHSCFSLGFFELVLKGRYLAKLLSARKISAFEVLLLCGETVCESSVGKVVEVGGLCPKYDFLFLCLFTFVILFSSNICMLCFFLASFPLQKFLPVI